MRMREVFSEQGNSQLRSRIPRCQTTGVRARREVMERAKSVSRRWECYLTTKIEIESLEFGLGSDELVKPLRGGKRNQRHAIERRAQKSPEAAQGYRRLTACVVQAHDFVLELLPRIVRNPPGFHPQNTHGAAMQPKLWQRAFDTALSRERWRRWGPVGNGQELAVLARFPCYYLLCGGRESKCRHAQGQRVSNENATRMPAKTKNQPRAGQNSKAHRKSGTNPARFTRPPAPTTLS